MQQVHVLKQEKIIICRSRFCEMLKFHAQLGCMKIVHHAAFHQGLHCLPKYWKKYTIFLEIITCDPSIYTMDDPDLIVCIFLWKIPLILKG